VSDYRDSSPAVAGTDALLTIKNARIAELEAAIERHWWWRSTKTGTICIWCGASCHFNLGIADIVHRDDCEYVRLAGRGGAS